MIHKTQIQKARSQRLWRLLSLVCLSSSLAVLPACNFSGPAKPFSSEVNPADSVAKITEVKSRPVWIRFLNTDSDQSATVGIAVKPGEAIRTEDSARAQIHLLNGDLVRVEGESLLTIAQKDTVNFEQGQLLAWSASKQTSPTQIKTPFGIISVSNTTVFVSIPKDASKDRQILALQDNVEIKLNSGSVPIKLKTGQELTIKSDGTISTPKNLEVAEVEKKLGKSKLLYGFDSRLESLAAIESRYTVSSSTTEADKVTYTRQKKAPAPTNTQARNTPQEAPAPDYERPRERSYEPPKRDPEPPPQTTRANPDPRQADPLALPSRTEPAPRVAEPPPQPVQPEVLPLEPPPLPVQPETPPQAAPAPIPAPEEPKTP